MFLNKADQVSMNEARKIRQKIEGHRREIKKLEISLNDIELRIKQK